MQSQNVFHPLPPEARSAPHHHGNQKASSHFPVPSGYHMWLRSSEVCTLPFPTVLLSETQDWLGTVLTRRTWGTVPMPRMTTEDLCAALYLQQESPL